MGSYRMNNHLVWRSGLLGLSLLMMLGFAACQPTSRGPAVVTSVPTAAVTATATATALSTVTAPATATAAATPAATAMTESWPITTTEGWLIYTNTPTGYTVEYPAGWTVNEQNMAITVFTSPDGQASIMVSVRPAPPNQTEPTEPSDLPNTRCQQVKIGPAFGTSCFDTIGVTRSTTLWHEGMIYTLTTTSKGMDRDLYDHLVNSFRPLARGSS
jgi:hypothetical protein